MPVFPKDPKGLTAVFSDGRRSIVEAFVEDLVDEFSPTCFVENSTALVARAVGLQQDFGVCDSEEAGLVVLLAHVCREHIDDLVVEGRMLDQSGGRFERRGGNDFLGDGGEFDHAVHEALVNVVIDGFAKVDANVGYQCERIQG